MEKSTAFLLALCLACTPIAQAQLSGEVSLGGASADQAQEEKQGNPQTKEITVTGIGTTLESAEKQALASAIRQAVGAYMDSKSIIENEEVIQDRILSVSNAFVEKYELIGQPKKSSDGLIEIIILAKVKTNQVVQALKEQNLISGEVAGQNLWAEASTKVMNAQDAVTMLETKIPEFIKNSVTITPLKLDGTPSTKKDATGKIVPSTEPVDMQQDLATGKATLLWIFAIGLDTKYYKDNIIPVVSSCFEAICGRKAIEKEVQISSIKIPFSSRGFKLPQQFKEESFKEVKLNFDLGLDRQGVVIVTSFSRTFDRCKFLSWQSPAFIDMDCLGENGWSQGAPGAFISVEIKDHSGDSIASSMDACWQPFFWSWFKSACITGPINPRGNYALPEIVFTKIEVPIDLLKEIKTINVGIKVPEMRLKIVKK